MINEPKKYKNKHSSIFFLYIKRSKINKWNKERRNVTITNNHAKF